MARYRKKPEFVEAWLFDGTWNTAKEIISGVPTMSWSEGSDGNRILIDTTMGQLVAPAGSWIVSARGGFNVLSPDTFAANYDEEG
jgi:hypothetical protein